MRKTTHKPIVLRFWMKTCDKISRSFEIFEPLSISYSRNSLTILNIDGSALTNWVGKIWRFGYEAL